MIIDTARIATCLRSTRRRAGCLAALSGAVGALTIAGCGNEVPSNAVAKVGDEVIERSEFDHWLNAAARSQQPPGGGQEVAVPDPPNFEKCVEARSKQPTPRGATKPSAEDLKRQCQQEFDALKQQVMQFLVSASWIEQEAEERDIEVSEEEIRKQFEDQKKQSFRDDKAYQECGKTFGRAADELLGRVWLDSLSEKGGQGVAEGRGEASEGDIEKD